MEGLLLMSTRKTLSEKKMKISEKQTAGGSTEKCVVKTASV